MPPDLDARAHAFRDFHGRLTEALSGTVSGRGETIRAWVAALLAGGHVLLEGVPGLGKTLLVRAGAAALGLDFRRIQCTPDLMPADITGTTVLREDPEGGRRLDFEPGPIFTHLLLADEINRATPKTQSALLEAMQEGTVTVSGQTRPLPRPFRVAATQNPVDWEGTYPLPEAELDRFLLKIVLPHPDENDLTDLLARIAPAEPALPSSPVAGAADLTDHQELARAVTIPEPVARRAARLVLATRPDSGQAGPLVEQHVRWGAGPRGALALTRCAQVSALLAGRWHVAREDLDAWIEPCLAHRLSLHFAADTESILPGLFAEIRARAAES